ncbi:restriction endonuclease subunit S [Thioalkalivibrio sp. ALE11]|uniref:restriction endonuclease subunit S n=1 Tax=Thioalkalivibrio sp. ALE11 TaxID=1265494 RepID=UPI0003828550|nr:restriction endonuclease subunit S [Thioalkalivibrio sp. ALE11]
MNATSSSVQLGAMDLYHPLPCPDGWTTRRLRFVTRINKAQPITLAPEDEVSFVPMAAIGEHGGIQLDQVKALDEIGDGYTYFADGDVVVAKITPCFENGKGAFAEGLRNRIAFGTTELHVIRPAKDMDGRFLFYLSISELFRKLGEGAMYGAGGQKRVPDQFIKDFQALVPPVDQQQKIAAFLDRKTAEIDTLIAKKRRLLDRLAEKRTALITRAVTKGLNPDVPMKDSGIEWLGEIPAHWDVQPVYSRYSVLLGKMLDERRIKGKNLVRYLRNVDVQWDSIRYEALPQMDIEEFEYSRYLVESGDLLVCEGGEIGRCAIVGELSEVTAYQKALHRLRPIRVEEQPRYMFYTLFAAAKNGVLSVGGVSTISHLTAEQLRRFRFATPPGEEQKEIAGYLDHSLEIIDSSCGLISTAIDRLEEYRSALITNAVTGQIKVA